jgi:hypothetical protein
VNDDKRNVLLLAAFSACLLTMCGILVVWQLRVPNQAEGSTVLGSDVSPGDLPPLDPPKLEGPYRAIADRNLFRNDAKLPQPTDAKASGGARQNVYRDGGGGFAGGGGGVEWIPPAPAGLWMPPSLSGPAPSTAWSPPASGPPRPPMDSDPGAAPPGPRLPRSPADSGPNVAITGIAGSGGAVRVLVENRATGETEWVAPGGKAFGYSVDYVTPQGGVVSKEGRSQVLGLGQNKKSESPPAASAKSGSSAPEAAPAKGKSPEPASSPKGGSRDEDH